MKAIQPLLKDYRRHLLAAEMLKLLHIVDIVISTFFGNSVSSFFISLRLDDADQISMKSIITIILVTLFIVKFMHSVNTTS